MRSPDGPGAATAPADAPAQAHEHTPLSSGWQVAATPPDADVELEQLSWSDARVPGTAAGAMRDAGCWRAGEARDFDAEDWWFRTSFAARPPGADEQLLLRLGGVATVAEVFLNGELVAQSDSMFAAHAIDVGERLRAVNELTIRCRALAPLLKLPRRPRARWRTRLVADGNLRFFRTMLLGRAPGFAPGPAAVGPWREVRLERRRQVSVDAFELRTSLDGDDGTLSVRGRLHLLGGFAASFAEVELRGPSGTHRAALALADAGATANASAARTRDGADVDADATRTLELRGELTVANVARWWPHTHGEPHLHEVRVTLGDEQGGQRIVLGSGRVGFRRLAFGAEPEHDVLRDGLALRVNGVEVFARGAVWTPVDPVGLADDADALRAALEQARDAGMNMLRIPGTSAYETDAFFDLCDELGMLVWQDLMFANLDYPIADAAFRATVAREATDVLRALAGRPSLAIVCGNSEVEQQVAMLGLDPALGRGELFGELLPGLLRDSGADALYVPSAPCGGELPFRPDAGIANYYGVGGYRRPLSDARTAGVRFAAECLAFSNVPDAAAIERMLPGAPGVLAVHHPLWKAGVPRDVGTGWDFEDVRDHYLESLFGVRAAELRRVEHERYLELSRAVTGEVMAHVFGEWRRADSTCGGGLVLWLRDLAPGAGWGLVDDAGQPKLAYHHLRRALAPVATWLVDEGLGGVVAHVANDRPDALGATLRLALYAGFERLVDEAEMVVRLGPHSQGRWNVETILGRFVDASWAYRFGPAAQDLIVVTLERAAPEEADPLSQAFHFPAGRPLDALSAADLGLEASLARDASGLPLVHVCSQRLAYGVRLHAPGFAPSDDGFSIEPRHGRTIALRPLRPDAEFAGAGLTAVNLRGRLAVSAAAPSP